MTTIDAFMISVAGPALIIFAYRLKPFPQVWQNILICYLPIGLWFNWTPSPPQVTTLLKVTLNLVLFGGFACLVLIAEPMEEKLQRWWDRRFGKQG